jgi:hypothetical protein
MKIVMEDSKDEIWKTINEFPNYEVSNFGRVRSIDRTIKGVRTYNHYKSVILSPALVGSGYYGVSLRNNIRIKTCKIHQLVAVAFLNHVINGNILVVNHIDCNKLNNNVNNLEIITHRENDNRQHIKTSSQYTGVSWQKNNKKWQAQIQFNGNCIYIGLFINELDAHLAYEKRLNLLTNNIKEL